MTVVCDKRFYRTELNLLDERKLGKNKQTKNSNILTALYSKNDLFCCFHFGYNEARD